VRTHCHRLLGHSATAFATYRCAFPFRVAPFSSTFCGTGSIGVGRLKFPIVSLQIPYTGMLEGTISYTKQIERVVVDLLVMVWLVWLGGFQAGL
jgi:hypothetical protein